MSGSLSAIISHSAKVGGGGIWAVNGASMLDVCHQSRAAPLPAAVGTPVVPFQILAVETLVFLMKIHRVSRLFIC